MVAAIIVLISLSSPAFPQNSLQLAVAIEGIVRSPAGEPVPGASVFLVEKIQATPIETKTNADGTFTLSAPHPGAYILRVKKSGWRDAVRENLQLYATNPKVNVVLERLNETHSSIANSDAMEFEDKPNFTVAGVTDSTQAGGHGSDAGARTSEVLARETVALKSDGINEISDQLLADGDHAKAREQVRKMLAKTDTAALHSLLGNLDERLGNPLEAVHEYEQAARMDPSEQNYFNWATELLLHRAVAPATEVFTKGTSLHPDSVRMLAGLGAALYAGGFYDQAATRLCAASDLKPSDPEPYLFLGRMEATAPAPLPCAEQKIARFVQTQPANALAHYYYAMTLLKRARESGDPAISQPTEAALKQAVTLDPKLGQAYLQLGILYYGKGEYEQSIHAYQKTIEVSPQLSEAHYRLGMVYQHFGDQAKAQQEFQTHRQVEKTEAAAVERQRKEVQQFLIVLKDRPMATPPK